MGRFSFGEIALVLVLALLFFGAGRVADIGKGLGEGIRNFKKGLREEDEPEKLPAAKGDGAKNEGDAA